MVKAFQAELNRYNQIASLEWIENLARQSLGYCISVLTDQEENQNEN